jgi:hypothetical protein
MKAQIASRSRETYQAVLLILLIVTVCQGSAGAQCCGTTIVEYPYVEDFESQSTCSTDCTEACPLTDGWSNDDGDDMDWIVDENTTPSSYTGPYKDHNPGTSSGNYLYTEADNCYNMTAILYSPCFDLTGLENPEVHFWYSMYGQHMGTMSLEVSMDNCGTWTEEWSLSGDQGDDDWYRTVISLDHYTDETIRLRFVGLTGDGHRSDMAIDDILLREMPCCPVAIVDYPYFEDFEGEETCETNCAEACALQGDWYNADTYDDMDWIVDENTTPSSYTGPYKDHNPGTSSGNYLYTEADNCYNSVAELYSPCFDLFDLENPELHFWYSMYGQHMGTLSLEISTDNCETWAELWSLSGDQGDDEWFRVVVPLDDYVGEVVRLRFVGLTGDGHRSDMAIDDIMLREVPFCPSVVTSYPYVEDFEGQSTCTTNCAEACPLTDGWSNADTDDDMDWIVDVNTTPSSYTGPYYDHNPGTSSGNYLYTEADNCYNMTAILYSPCFDLADLENPELHFWYSMYGQHMGTMTLELSEGDYDTWTQLWSLSGDQGDDEWFRAVVPLGDYVDKTVRLRFVGTTGDGHRSDMAIDDILLREMPCCPVTIIDYPYYEAFEGEETCETNCAEACALQGDWYNADTYDDMDWIVDENTTPSSYTGPYKDHNPGTSSGNYLYTEADNCYNMTAEVYSPCFDLAGLENPEFHFWYSMYGQHMGTLTLEISTDDCGSWSELWSRSGDQGDDDWVRIVVPLGDYVDQIVRLRFVGLTGDGHRSDMAIDDIMLREMPCCPTTVASFPYVQDFEDQSPCETNCSEACPLRDGWFNADTNDDMDWIVDVNTTPSSYTGPYKDHNPGTSSGNYLYTEADNCYNMAAVLYSPCFDFEELNNPELRFWYSMYGQHMGTLAVEISEDDCGTWSEIWTLSGDQGDDDWREAYVDLAAYSGEIVRLRLIGTTGDGHRSDMAIDDLSIDGEITTSSTCATTVSVFPYDETFEAESLCGFDCTVPCDLPITGWTNPLDVDGTDWLVAMGGTPTEGTGPTDNHTPETPGGRYLYLESTGCLDMTAELYSPCFDLTHLAEAQFSFWYHMYGNGMGSLSVEVAEYHSKNWTPVWSRTGEQGNVWLRGEIDLRDYEGRMIWLRFSGQSGAFDESDMALDDMSLEGRDVSMVGVGGIPRTVALHQNVPNPFNPMTEIRYDLPSATKVRLHVLDLNGRVVRTLISGLMQPGGRHSITWGGRDDRGQKVASGTYIYQLRTSDFVEMRRMVLLK